MVGDEPMQDRAATRDAEFVKCARKLIGYRARRRSALRRDFDVTAACDE
jgi:hypothetical protein